jgi:hypothetical protein
MNRNWISIPMTMIIIMALLVGAGYAVNQIIAAFVKLIGLLLGIGG